MGAVQVPVVQAVTLPVDLEIDESGNLGIGVREIANTAAASGTVSSNLGIG